MPRRVKRSRSSKDAKTSSRRIPQNVKNEMIKRGADFEDFEDEDLCRISVVYGDEAWEAYENWAETTEAEPGVLALFGPSDEILESVLCPSVDLSFHIMKEANSIIFHYASMLSEHFLPPPALPPAIPGPVHVVHLPISIQHAKVALSGLMQRIQNPPATYPTLSGLRPGSYICHVHQQWTNAVVVIALFKP